MEWPKLKNIILIILALTNLCLLVFVVQRELQNNYLQRRARSDAVQFLADRGVTVTEAQIPDKETLLPQTVARNLEEEEVLAGQLLGGSIQVEALGGGVYRYFNGNGSIQFHSDGAFSGQFAPGVLPVGENREEDCLKILERLGFEGELLEADGDNLTFRQLWDGWPLFNQQVTLELRDGCLAAMEAGYRLVGQPVEDTTRETVTVATALIELFNGINALGGVCSRVDTIARGYVSGTTLTGPMTLTPVWHVTTDTGAYQLDLITGAVTRLN